jgi:hypothetical protein
MDQWYAVLRRPPETWSVGEVATWAWMPAEHGGAGGLEWLAAALHAGCVDGGLLLSLEPQQVAGCLLRGRADTLATDQATVMRVRH